MGTFRVMRLLHLLLLGLFLAGFAAPVQAAKQCYECHQKAQTKFESKKILHDPVKQKNCESCHKRHGFANQLVLVDNTSQLCFSCHKDLKDKFATGSVHFPVAKGVCWDCHDPHSSDRKGLIKADSTSADPDGCLSCHKDQLQAFGKAKHPHTPYEKQDCVSCHNPHNSPNVSLLQSDAATLCATCHKPDDKKTIAAHEGKFIAGLKCEECHTGHSTDAKGLLSSNTHAPFSQGTCDACHALPDTAGKVAFATGVTAGNVCGTCHADQAAGPTLKYPHPAVEAENCDNCHTPHSSTIGKLLKQEQGKICRECHTDIAGDTTKFVHAPVALNECSLCHEVHGSNTEHLLKKTGSALCLDCHLEYKQGRDSATTVHAGAEDCLNCHNPHQGKARFLLKKEPKDLCLTCHKAEQQALTATSSHQPYLDGDCSGCHDPHFTKAPHLTRDQGPKLCLSCHVDIDKRLNMSTVHPPAKDDCGNCHKPHFSEQKKLLTTSPNELCQGCHDPKDIGATGSNVHSPVASGNCIGCHDPHGSDQKKLLSGQAKPVTVKGITILRSPQIGEKRADLCYTCHETLQDKFRSGKIHSPVSKGDCDACHANHGSDNPAFIKDTPAKLCATCHALDQALSAKHDNYNLETANCVDCHNPHSSTRDKLLRTNDHPPFAEKSCETCHTVGPDGKPQLTAQISDICATCHDLVASETAKKVHHPPFEAGQCTDCHSPHTSDFKKLLHSEGNDLCLSCHSDIKDLQHSPVQHKPFTSGKCLDCHAPHAAQNERLLLKPAEALCLTCHTVLKDQLGKGDVHAPVKQGKCLACHLPHAGQNPALLVAQRSELCARCHNLKSPAIATAHHGFDMTNVNCQNCHAAHVGQKGSKGLLLPKSHQPFVSRNCAQCHQPTGKHELIAEGRKLCESCHKKFDHSMTKAVVHPPVAEDNGCVKCHSPHVGFTKNLLKKDGPPTCLTCHDNREFTGAIKHKVAFENCANCHEPHSGDYKYLLDTPDIMGLCLKCHPDATKTHYHPMTKATIDPRTKQPINCVSCHSPHSSDFESLLIADKNRKLCVTCHDVNQH
jgi:predicted CXXCH cytochrome family protein